MKSPLVLMYHGVVDSESSAVSQREAGAELYDLPVENFRKQMEFLKKEEPYAIEEERIILTFDDGEANNFHNAFPILRNLNFTASFFVTVNRIGKKGYMNWEELKELRDCGMTVGSHGLNHEILTNLKEAQLKRELLESKEILEKNLKVNVDYFSVPRGFYNNRVLNIARECGYKKVFTSDAVTGDFCFGRIPVKGNWPLSRFRQALKGEMPFSERVGEQIKGVAKRILGAGLYNQIRSGVLRGNRLV